MSVQRPIHHESREAVPIVQATSKAGIVIGVTRFGTVPDAMIVIVVQLASGLALKRWIEDAISPAQAPR